MLRRVRRFPQAAVYGKAAGGGGAYVGPGDIAASAFSWYGLRGYSAAYSTGSNPAVDLVDQAGGNLLTVNILSNGRLDTASISTWVTAHSVTTIFVTRIYDQSGAALHATQATLANMPVLTLNAIGSLPAMQFTGANATILLASAAPATLSNPTFSGVAQRSNSAFSGIFINSNSLSGVFTDTGANNLAMYNGNVVPVGGNDGAFHAFQMMFNSAASSSDVDGSTLSGLNPGANLFNTGSPYSLGGFAPYLLTGFISEVGVWSGNFSSPIQVSMNSNQHTYWGF